MSNSPATRGEAALRAAILTLCLAPAAPSQEARLATVHVTFRVLDEPQRRVLSAESSGAITSFESSASGLLIAALRRRFPMFRFVADPADGALELEAAIAPQGPFPSTAADVPGLDTHLHFRCRLAGGSELTTSCMFRSADTLDFLPGLATLTQQVSEFLGVDATGALEFGSRDINARYEILLRRIVAEIPLQLAARPQHVANTRLVTANSPRRDFGCSIPDNSVFTIDAEVPEPGFPAQPRRFRSRVLPLAEILARTQDAVLKRSLLTRVEAAGGDGTSELHVSRLDSVNPAATVAQQVHIESLGAVEHRCLEFLPSELDLGAAIPVDAAESALRAALPTIEGAVHDAKFDEAGQVLAGLGASPGDSLRATATRQFAAAWIAARAAVWNDDATAAAALLTEARDDYRSILDSFRFQPQAVVNLALVLVQLEQPGSARELLEASAAQASDTSVRLALADLQRAQGDVDHALSTLTALVEGDPGNRAAEERIAAIARDRDPLRSERFLALADQMVAYGHSDLADSIYLDVVNASHATRPEVAEIALLRWSSTSVETGAFAAADLELLPTAAEWSNAKVAALRDLATTTRDAARFSSEFGGDPAAQQVAAGILVMRAESALAAGRDRESFDLAKAAWDSAPTLDQYAQGGALAGKAPVGVIASSTGARSVVRQRASFTTTDLDALAGKYPRSMLKELAKLDPERAQTSLQSIGVALALHGDAEVGRSYLEDVLLLEDLNSRRKGVPSRALPDVHAVTAESFRRQGLDLEADRARLDAAEGYLRNQDGERAKRQFDKIDRERLRNTGLRDRVDMLDGVIRLDRDIDRIDPGDAVRRLRELSDRRPRVNRGATEFELDANAELLGLQANRIDLRAKLLEDRAATVAIDNLRRAADLDPKLIRERLERGTMVPRIHR